MNKFKDPAIEKTVNDAISDAKKKYPELTAPGSKIRYAFGDFGTEDLVDKFMDDGITTQLDFIATTFVPKIGRLCYISADTKGIVLSSVVVEVETVA